MTGGSLKRADRSQKAGVTTGTPPVLVLGLGNLLLEDDGVGLRLLEALRDSTAYGDGVEFIDGGTQGLALLPCLDGRAAVLVLDAIGLGRKPGTVHVLRNGAPDGAMEEIRARRASTAHEGNALELFQMARILGGAWDEVAVVGVEPASMRTGIGLSAEVEASVQEALTQAQQILREMVQTHVFSNSR